MQTNQKINTNISGLQKSLKQESTKLRTSDVGIGASMARKAFSSFAQTLPGMVQKEIFQAGLEMCTSHNSTPAADGEMATSATSDR